jgi:two-component system, NarL family, sensor histidine kinase DegS
LDPDPRGLTDVAGERDGGLAELLANRQAAAQRELDEIELLMRQARIEADRHAARREASAERLASLMDQHSVPADVREAHDALILQHQRSALMSAQMEVLEGKQKVLQRLASSLDEVVEALQAAGVADIREAPPGDAQPEARTAEAPATVPARLPPSAVLTAQEELRRAIARQMHDGPAQSIANIALQAEVVQRLLARDPAGAQRELSDLRGMVQHALEATKSFIFEVRPMVLDDLGLVPTLRRAAGEHQRRSGLPVRFESVGPDRRLEPHVETQVFRIIDDALEAYLERQPSEVALRLNWTESQLSAVIRSRPPASEREQPAASAASSAAVPNALADMIRDQHADEAAREEARQLSYAMPGQMRQDLAERAGAVGLNLLDGEGGLRIEVIITWAVGTRPDGS